MITKEKQMSSGRPETLGYPLGKRHNSKTVNNQILRSCSKRFAQPWVSRMEDY
jgi:hypothetical protein